MRRRRKSAFRFVFFIYVCLLVVAATAALIYVNATLREYENEHPNRHVEVAVENLRSEAADGSLWTKEGMPDMNPGKFETNVDVKSEFTRLINGDVTYTPQKWTSDTECVIGIKTEGMIIAEATLVLCLP